MKLWFENTYGKARIVARVDGRHNDDAIRKEAMERIRAFCEERNYTIPYVRLWSEDWRGKQSTVFDVGSHTEFFYLTK